MAVNVTGVPSAKFALHAEPPEPQFIPAGFDLIVPFAGGVPKSTLRPTAKLAVHVVLALMGMVHVGLLPQEAQAPPHPTKT